MTTNTRKQWIDQTIEQMKAARPDMAATLDEYRKVILRISKRCKDDDAFQEAMVRQNIFGQLMVTAAQRAGIRPDQTIGEVVSDAEQRNLWSQATALAVTPGTQH
jgi:hypothetical protein